MTNKKEDKVDVRRPFLENIENPYNLLGVA